MNITIPSLSFPQKGLRIALVVVIVAVIASLFIVTLKNNQQKNQSSSSVPKKYTSLTNSANEHLTKRGFRVAKEAVLPPSFTCALPNEIKTIGSGNYSKVCDTLPSTFTDQTHVVIAWKSKDVTRKDWSDIVAKEVLQTADHKDAGVTTCEKDMQLKGGMSGERRFCTVTGADKKSYLFAQYFFTSGNSQNGEYVLYSYNVVIDNKASAVQTMFKQTFDKLSQNFFIYIPQQQVQPKSSSFFNIIERAHASGDGDGGGGDGESDSVVTNPDDRGGNEEGGSSYFPPVCTAPQYLVADWYCQVTFNGDIPSTLSLAIVPQTTQSDALAQCSAGTTAYSGWTPSVQIVPNSGTCTQPGATPTVELNFSLFDFIDTFVEKVFASK